MRARLPGQMVVHEVPALEPDAAFDGYFLRPEPAQVVEAVCRCARGLHWALPWGGEELCRRGCFREEKKRGMSVILETVAWESRIAWLRATARTVELQQWRIGAVMRMTADLIEALATELREAQQDRDAAIHIANAAISLCMGAEPRANVIDEIQNAANVWAKDLAELARKVDYKPAVSRVPQGAA